MFLVFKSRLPRAGKYDNVEKTAGRCYPHEKANHDLPRRVFAVRAARIVGEEDLIAKARQEINLAEADSIQMVIAGKSAAGHDAQLFWFITGNEYQAQRPHPIEFTALGGDAYKFVKTYHPIPRGQDIYALLWRDGYSFCVNNPDCKTIRITDNAGVTEIPVTEYPFVCYSALPPYDALYFEYLFLDGDGNEIR